MSRLVTYVALVLALVLLSAGAHAQVRGLGRFTGTVVDQAGNPIEGVAIKTPLAGGAFIETSSNAKGQWTILGVGKGEWKVDFEKAGFTPVKLKVTVERELDVLRPVKITLKR